MAIISISHLNIINALADINTVYKKQTSQAAKSFPPDEQNETEKETKGKEKSEEQEKFYNKVDYSLNNFHLSSRERFICFSTTLNVHPYQEDDIQPPRVV